MKAANKIHNVSQFKVEQKLNDFSLQNLIKNVLTVAQCFAILPVDGARRDVQNLRFRWLSIRTIYTILVVISLVVYSAIVSIYSITSREGFFSFVVIAWNLRSLTTLIVFLRLARKWPALLREWEKVDFDMLSFGPMPKLKRTFATVPLLFLIGGLCEHAIFLYGGVTVAIANMKEDDNFLRKFFETNYRVFFDLIDYAAWKAIYVEFSVVITTAIWQFCDLFIVLMSSALAERFRQINNYIKTDKVLTEMEWRKIRKQYNKLSLLCKQLNSTMSEAVIISFLGNVYFLAVSVFQSFKSGTAFETFYVCFGIIFTMCHFMIVSIYGAWVHEESFEALSGISSLPVKYISHEVDRLLHQMAERNVAIQGGGLFTVTRSIVLNVVNVIVALQLIFVQFKAQFSSKVV